jgi:single-strand DNA-binding protein
MQVKGKVLSVKEVVVISDKFRKCEVWLTTSEEYPQTLSIQFANDKADAASNGIKAGDDVTIDINLRGRKWTNQQGEEKVFNTIEGWKFERVGGEPLEPIGNFLDEEPPF